MPSHIGKSAALYALLFIIILSGNALSDNSQNSIYNQDSYKLVDIEHITRYNEERLVLQHIEKEPSTTGIPDIHDNSIETFLIIQGKRIYLIIDGYDNPEDVKNTRLTLEMENKLIPDLWVNKIDNKPDYIRITERRVEILKKIDKEYVEKNFGNFYRNTRNKFIEKHVQIFKTLMKNRRESGLYVVKKLLPKRTYDTGPTKFYTSATAKAADETVYFAEDADGDGITETFTVALPDGFSWGYKSGPNIIFIFNNRGDKSNPERANMKDIENIIGTLTNQAYYGTTEEEKELEKTFPKESEIGNMIDDIYRNVEVEESQKKKK